MTSDYMFRLFTTEVLGWVFQLYEIGEPRSNNLVPDTHLHTTILKLSLKLVLN